MEVTSSAGSSTALDTGDDFSVIFIGIYGDLPLLSGRPASRATVSSVTQGDAPFRKETQAFSCVADAVGDLVMTWRGLGNVTIGAGDDLETFESAFSSGLTNVSIAGMESGSVCSGELVYITFEEVRF